MTEPMWVLFTKRWAPLPPEQLGEVVAGLGFDGIELPVRPGSWVSPEDVGAYNVEVAANGRPIALVQFEVK